MTLAERETPAGGSRPAASAGCEGRLDGPTATALPMARPPAPGGGAPDRGDAPVRGAGLLRALERPALALERAAARVLPDALNPLVQTGAVAGTCLVVALVTGVLLLVWYTPSLSQAYASVEAMGAAPWTAGLCRSLHRYSSDACVLFALVHALRLVLARRFAGARWLAWVTGVAALGMLWLVGWLGYWLVWDARAARVAVGTARALDALPIFAEPLERSFLTDASVNSFLFFVVFFLHMLVPLPMGVALWLHVARSARARYLTRGALTAYVLGGLVAASVLVPATSAAPAHMVATPAAFSMDWWFLLPLALTDRLGAGALWGLSLGLGAAALSLPWTLGRGRARPAAVDTPRCNACRTCVQDCPYDAIRLVPRTDGRRDVTLVAQVDPARCVGCGICAGSCNSTGIGLPWLPTRDARERLEAWIDEAATAGAAERPGLAVACVESAGGALRVDPATGTSPDLPGWRVLLVPCAGWLHTLTLERALRRGAPRALVVTCPEGSCRYREGVAWTRARLAGQREPVLRRDRVDAAAVQVVALDRGAPLAALAAAARGAPAPAAAGAGGAPAPAGAATATPPRWRRRVAAGVGVAAGVAAALAALVLPSDAPYRSPVRPAPELVVSFKHPGRVSEVARTLTAEERAQQLPHMRQDVVRERRRAPVRLRVTVDGQPALARTYAPGGLWGDGNSVGLVVLPVAGGEHRVEVALGDSEDAAEWAHVEAHTLRFGPGERHVVLFERAAGFTWE